ncbi:MAG: hypothetical protein DRP96_08435, partial [Candidatus Neomarinimicrobiota bacterium]
MIWPGSLPESKTKSKSIIVNRGLLSKPARCIIHFIARNSLHNAAILKSSASITNSSIYSNLKKIASKKKLRKESRKYPVIKRFLKIPGVGIVTATTFFTIVDDPNRFDHKQKLWAYAHLGKAVH